MLHKFLTGEIGRNMPKRCMILISPPSQTNRAWCPSRCSHLRGQHPMSLNHLHLHLYNRHCFSQKKSLDVAPRACTSVFRCAGPVHLCVRVWTWCIKHIKPGSFRAYTLLSATCIYSPDSVWTDCPQARFCDACIYIYIYIYIYIIMEFLLVIYLTTW